MASTLESASDTMLAVVKSGPGPGAVALREVPVRAVPPGFARVQVTAAGICGTDLHIAADEYPYEAPVVMGHEILGQVIETGSSRDAHWIGQQVACETYFSTCEHCVMCRAARRNLCLHRRSLGSFEDGGFAESVVLPVINLHELPPTLDDYDGVLAEPLACVAQCLLTPSVVNAGDDVLVLGPGAMGQLSAQVARSQGGRVTLAGLPQDAARLKIATDLGFTTTTGVLEEDTFNVVIECSGAPPAAAAGFAAIRRGGRYIQTGIFGRAVTVLLDTVLYKELTISSGFASTATSWNDAMRLITQQHVQLRPLVTKVQPLEQFSAAFDSVRRGDGIKTVLVPRHS
jgi:L-iditol 2-dehydrogenase